jgi:serine/threonine-protein kinase
VLFLEGLGTAAGATLGVLTLDGGRTDAPIIGGQARNAGAEVSPDGRWLAYESDESGELEVYVRPFPDVNAARWQVSANGGTRPAWAKNGRELFYLDAANLLTVVPVQSSPTFSAGAPQRLHQQAYYPGFSTRGFNLRAYDVSRDGQRFLMLKNNSAAGLSTEINIVLNWAERFRTR